VELVRPLWSWLGLCGNHNAPTRRTLILEELENTSSSPRVSPSVSSILNSALLVSYLLVVACHIGKFTIVAYLENLPFMSSLN
jgi:hypothetical protein